MQNFDCIFGFSVKSYVGNIINLSWDKIVLTGVITEEDKVRCHTQPTQLTPHTVDVLWPVADVQLIVEVQSSWALRFYWDAIAALKEPGAV
jgi:hypothetical protein